MGKPTVAIIGKPNVGKSTFFNYIVGSRISIVEDTPGVTRDRVYAETNWRGRNFTVVDTAGIEPESEDIIISQMREQAQIEYENEKAIYQLRNELDTQKQKTLTEYEYTLKQKYGSSSSSSSAFDDYDKIIQNRYAEYNSLTRQYVVPSEEQYNQLANYLDSLYASGAITEDEFLKLSAKYSKYEGQTFENTTENNSTENSDNSISNQNKKKRGLWEALTQPLDNHFSELF